MSFALLFSGQGVQHPDMWSWLRADQTMVQATQELLGVKNWRHELKQQAGWATRNSNAQVLLTGLSLAAWFEIGRHLPAPAALAGYSVGELAAFSAAGCYDGDVALNLARARAHCMDLCAASNPGGLLAITGLPAGAAEQLCKASGANVAIRLDSADLVLGGGKDSLCLCAAMAADMGGKCTELAIEVPSHTPQMAPAAKAFATALEGIDLRPPSMIIYDNLSAEPVTSATQARHSLAGQIANTVRWADCMDALASRRVACALEIGPGAALAAKWNRRFPEIPARSADEFRSALSVADWVRKNIN